MACGIYLGVLLVYLLQAEHVICSWASQEARGMTYVGFGQYGDGHLRRKEILPQNNFRQAAMARASAQSGSDGLSRAHGLANPRSAYSSLKMVRPRPAAANVAVPKKPKRPYLSSPVASSGSVSRHHQRASHPTGRKDAGLERGGGEVRSSIFLPGYGKRKFLAGMKTSAKGTASKVQMGQETVRWRQASPKHSRGQMSFKSQRQWRQWPGADRRLSSPMDVLIIPERYGGFPIRRLKEPKPPKVALGRSAARHLRPETKWTRVKLPF
ncbi:uncharacterized protein LOC144214885 [Stigmatopora nigra]